MAHPLDCTEVSNFKKNAEYEENEPVKPKFKFFCSINYSVIERSLIIIDKH